MLSNDPTVLLVLGEIVVVLSIAILMLLAGMLFRKRKQSRLLSTMLHRVSDNEETRKQALRSSLSGISGIDSKTVENIIDELVSQENSFYRLIASAFIDNKTSCIGSLDDEVHKLVAPYGSLFSRTSEAEKIDNTRNDESDNPGFDDAINDLLSDDGSATESNPEFDLSDTEEISGDDDASPSRILGIAEIPEDLLGDAADTADGESSSKNN